VNRSRRLRKGKASGPEHLHDAGPRTDKSVGKQKRRREAKPHIHEDQLAPVRGSERLADPSPVAATNPAIVFVSDKHYEALAKLAFEATGTTEGLEVVAGRHIVVIDADRDHAERIGKALIGVATTVRVLALDVGTWLTGDPAGSALAKLAKAAPLWRPDDSSDTDSNNSSNDEEDDGGGDDGGDELLIAELAALNPLTIQYAKRKREVAHKLGIAIAELDKIVAKARTDATERNQVEPLYDHWDSAERWDEPVDGDALLQELVDVLRRYVFMTIYQAVAVALWTVCSWLHEAITHCPLLFVTSAEADSGKTTLLGVLSFLVRRGMTNVEISGPALFRSIKKWQPSFVIDEADDCFSRNNDLRSVINSGWTRGSGVIRCNPETNEPELYSTFAPKVIAMKGRKLPDTTLSRSITIEMVRQRPDESERRQDFNHLDNETFARLRSQLVRFASDNVEALTNASPETPSGFHNRRRANWMPLLAIAELAGGQWKTAAWEAAQAIEATHDTFDPSIGVQLLAAIKDMFDEQNTDRLKSQTLRATLIEDQTGPWVAFGKDRKQAISESAIARLLKPFGIRPRTIRFADETAKGYQLAWFEDVFQRTWQKPRSKPSHRHNLMISIT
jgi:hypothetical protein